MQATTFLIKAAILLVMLLCNGTLALSQDISWMKGTWKAASGTPYQVPPVHCINTLEITGVTDSVFKGMQTTYFAMDTAVNITYYCTGALTKKEARFSRENVVYKKNSRRANFKWNDCAGCSARTCSLYVEQNKILLRLVTNNCDSLCNGTIVYYRDLNEFDTLIQQQLTSLYSRQSYTGLYAAYTLPVARNANTIVPEQNGNSTINLPMDEHTPAVLRERTSKLQQTLQLTASNIEVILLDDAEIDGDIVSLYDNNVEVLSHKMIGKEVVKYSFKADKQHPYHELVLVAENLGSIPPNTALMRIRAGDKKYELTTRSNMHENAKVIIEYTGD